MKVRPRDFEVRPGHRVRLKKWPTRVEPVYRAKEEYQQLLEEHREKLRSLQERLYASNRYAVLIIFQAMDAAGKDGAIAHVMSGLNPQGSRVYSFKHPTPEELRHDFLWRTTRYLPERGQVGIFNRSYYEEVLIVRVHPEIFRAEEIPDAKEDGSLWAERYRSINHLEEHLARNGTRILKFFLHLSKEEQRKRFLDRIDTPDKNWKITPADIQERGFWKEYQRAYEDCLNGTSTEAAPWYIVPADDKDNARLIISQILLDAFKRLRLAYPTIGPDRRAELRRIRARLEK